MTDLLLVNLNGMELFAAHLPEGPPRTNPLGILSLAAACEAEGLRVALRTFTLDWHRRSAADVEAFLDVLDTDAPVIGIGCDSAFLPFLLSSLPALRRRHPGRKLVLGGYGPTMAAEAIARDFPQVDALVKGEAEGVLPEVVRRLTRGESLAGLAGVHPEGFAPRIADLDRLPMTPWHLVDLEGLEEATLLTSRGCPYPCPYCSIRSVWQARNVPQSLDRVMEEIALLRLDHGIRRIRLYDDTFTMDRPRALEFCRRLQEERLDVEWFCYARIDRIDEELAEAMAEAGCTRIRFGLESASDRVLGQIKGGYTAARAWEALQFCARCFQVVEVNYMYGFPFEEWEDFQATMRAALELTERELARVILYRLTLYPLTPLYDRYRDQLRLDPASLPPEFRREWRLLEPFVRAHPEVCAHYRTVPSPELPRKERAVRDFSRFHYRGELSRDLAAIRRGVPLPGQGSPTEAPVPVLPALRS